MAPTTKVKELKKDWSRIGRWEWNNNAYVCMNVEVLSSRLSNLSKFGLFKYFLINIATQGTRIGQLKNWLNIRHFSMLLMTEGR